MIAKLFTNLGTSFKKTYRTKKITALNLTITALLLALTLLANLLSGVLKFNIILNFDFSLVFVLVAFFFVGWSNGLIVILSRFIIMPWISISLEAPLPAAFFGHFILLVTHMIYITTFTLMYHILKKVFLKKYELSSEDRVKLETRKEIIIDTKNFYLKYSVIFALTIIITTFLITILNIFFLAPMFFWIFSTLGATAFPQNNPWVTGLLENYERSSYNIFFLGFSDYYLGASVLFGTFNLANLTLNSILISLLLFTDYKTGLLSKLKGDTISRY